MIDTNTSKPILVALGFVVAVGVIGSVFSPVNIVSILGFCSVVVVSLLGMIKANETSEKVGEVKTDLAKSNELHGSELTKIKETGEKVHTLVNSNMGVQLRLNATLSRRVADLTTDYEEKRLATKAAELAESLLTEHEGKQAIVDRKEEKETKPEDKSSWHFMNPS